jgi:hypothetical protein
MRLIQISDYRYRPRRTQLCATRRLTGDSENAEMRTQ